MTDDIEKRLKQLEVTIGVLKRALGWSSPMLGSDNVNYNFVILHRVHQDFRGATASTYLTEEERKILEGE